FFGSIGLFFFYRTISGSELANLESNIVVKGAIYKMRHDDQMKQLLGEDIKVETKTLTKGHFNMFKGHADLQFKVKGSISEALVKLKGERTAAKDVWNLSTFDVEPLAGSSTSVFSYA
ncbi:cytochrome oxidase complex assembly protein 1-domain-containing protein, partial [Obelidium mucronatum]